MDPVEQVLADPDNDLKEMASGLRASGASCRHVDRHVMAEAPPAAALQDDLLRTASLAALALARKWIEQSQPLRSSGLVVSRAYAIIDDEWLAGADEAPPPHVYICLARDQASFAPVEHPEAVPAASSGNRVVDSLLTGREQLFRIEGAFEGEPGAWILKPGEQVDVTG